MVGKWIKRIAILLAIIIFLIAGLLLFLHTPTGKSIVRKKVENYLRQKWMTEVHIGNIDYRLPNWLALENVLILDHRKDTLLSGKRLYVGIRLLKLLSNTIDISGVNLETITLHCNREISDSTFNFQFILDAFRSAPDTNPKPPPGVPMQLSVNQLHLDHVSFSLNDKREKFYFSASIDSFSCFPSELKLKQTSYRIHQILLRNSRVTIIDSSSAGNSAAKANMKSRGDPSTVLVSLDKLQLQNIRFSYHQPSRKNDFSIQLDSLQLNKTTLDLGQQSINTRNIRLSNTAVNLLTWVPVNTSLKENNSVPPSANDKQWQIRADTISFRNNSFIYHNAAIPAIKGLDYQHLNVQGINLETRQSTFDSFGLYTELDLLSLWVNNQVHLKRLSAVVRLTPNLLNVKDLTLAINQSQLAFRGNIVWELKPGSQHGMPPRFVITNAFINYGDLLLIQPYLKKTLPVSFSPSESIMMAGIFSGAVQNLTAKEFSLSTSGRQFQFKGNIDLKIGKAGPNYSAVIHQLHLKKQLLSKDLLQQLEKENITLPAEIDLTGQVQGDAEKLQTDLKLHSNFGQLHVKGVAKNISHPERLNYNVQLNANQLETGKWIGLDSVLGKITGQIIVKGAGVQKNNLAIDAQLQLQSAMINGYPYSNINLQGRLGNNEFTTLGNINDPNLQAQINLNGRFGSGPAIKGNINIEKADLTQLGLTSDTIAFASNISVNADYTHPPKMQALIQADSNTITIRGKKIFTDSLSFVCNADKDSTTILVNAPMISATLKSNYKINTLPSEIPSILRTIYLTDHPLQNHIPSAGQNHYTCLNVTLAQTEVLSSLVPQLELQQPITIKGIFDASRKDSALSVQLVAPGIRYNNYEVHNLYIQAESVDSSIQYAVSGSEVLIGTKLLTNASITGRLQKDLLFVKALVNDEKGKEFYSGHVAIETGKAETTIRILEDLTLNYNKWKVPNDNWIRILKDGYIINHLSFENRGQTLYVHSRDLQTLSPIDIRIDNFDIGNVVALLSRNDTLLASGTLNADFNLQQPISKIPIITGDIHATNLAVFNIPVGEFNFHSATKGDSLVLQGNLSGSSQVSFDGSIHLNNRDVNIRTRLQKLDMNLVQELTKDILSRISGQITGELQLEGSPDTPHIRGTINLDSISFALKDLNAPYRIDKQKLVINYPELNLGPFTLSDTAGHQLTIQGKVQVLNPGELGLNIDIDTKNFVALNAPRRPGSPIYGTGIIDANVSIKGTSTEPVIEGNAYLHEKSNVHFLLTSGSNFSQNRKTGIVFVNIDTLKTTAAPSPEPEKDTLTARKTFKGLKYNLNLRVNKDAEFSVIIDPTTNDELVIKGEGRLNAGLQENGTMGITGVYQLQSGYYKMNNLLLRGKFMLVKGSTISFDGDPMSAVADVTTEYEIQTTSKGLLEYRETDDPDYSQRLPFLVVLIIKGPVSKPDISFDIKLKEGKAGLKSSVKADVEHALERLRNDVTAMNKQVFSLLLTKRFTSTSGGTDLASSNLNANNALQEGVSSFLTEAMNQVADQLIKGVDIDVNMKSYKTGDDPVSKTDLGVAMSKELLQNRLTIRVEENFAVGGDASTAPKSGTQYIPDVTSTYKLSRDGRYQVKAYQKNEYDAVVQGYFTEVGVSFTIELTYDRFKEIFQRKKQSPGGEK